MTIICAVHRGDRTWIGSDTLCRMGNIKINNGPKWVCWGKWAVGTAGDLRSINVFEQNAKQLFDDLSGPFDFSERVRDMLPRYGFDLKPPGNDEQVPLCGQDMILACPEGIWAVPRDLCIVNVGDYWADGSGLAFALGAMHALQGSDPEVMMRAGLNAAMTFEAACGGDEWIEVLD